ncbi:MAG: aminotransferase class III-fold pyridoxal phosphate-dependent enzyme, partial [Eggerthellaceae bacterium]|nr:aminotransferase class III-fold pyridoxal phosphate-dependent enzyme [Eggerthellaceae bacterium]
LKQAAFEPLPAGFISIPINDVSSAETLFCEHGEDICAVLVECVQGESGIHPCTREFLQTLRRLTEKYKALLICDEVQSGIFRTGKPFAFQNYGIIPDIVTMAKGIGSGIPMGAVSARNEYGEVFEPGDHGSTFGGGNLAMAAAYVTLTTLRDGDFLSSVDRVGAYLRERLMAIPKVESVRGLGLMVGADLKKDAPRAPEVVDAALENGLVINATGPRTLRFLPPLICTEHEVDVMIERLEPLLS